jgi:EAL domain-containing protein (putative c-di-GMP-specific phosphodiesterase class I)
VRGVEALVRWQRPGRGLIAARDFMPLAGEAGLAIPIGRFVVEQALAQLGRWRARKPDMTISLNLSSPQLLDPTLPSLLTEAIAAAGLEPAAVCLEITETELAADDGRSISALKRLKATGVRLAIDDFGAGACALGRLRELPIDALKIHESFVAGLGASPEDALVVGALVKLGHALGLDVVAEGVETEAQLEQLRKLGCDAAQGHAIGRPVSGEQLDALLVAEAA